MAQVAVNKNGEEVLGERLERYAKVNNRRTGYAILYLKQSEKIEPNVWVSNVSEDFSVVNGATILPKGTIKKLIGKELTWEDAPVDLI